MPTTKAKITEQIQRAYARFTDRENLDPVVYKAEIKELVNQAINEILQVKTMQEQTIYGVHVPQSSLLTYTSVSVASNKCTLPAFPINLRKDLGVWEIVDTSATGIAYIPIEAQKFKTLRGTILAGLERQIAFYRVGDTVYFTSDMSGVSTVDITLIVSDFSEITDNDPLPLSADLELQVIDRVLLTLSNGAFSIAELQSINNAEELTRTGNKNIE